MASVVSGDVVSKLDILGPAHAFTLHLLGGLNLALPSQLLAGDTCH